MKITIDKLGDNSVRGYYAKDWFENFKNMYSFNEYMLDQKDTVISATFIPQGDKLSFTERECIQSNKDFCDKYKIILNIDIYNE